MNIDQLKALEAKATKGPWVWGNGWDDPILASEDSDERGSKYADCRLLGPDGAEVIPIRVDHYEPIWDTTERCEQPTRDDRALIAALRNAAPHLIAVVDIATRIRDDMIANGDNIVTDPDRLDLCTALTALEQA